MQLIPREQIDSKDKTSYNVFERITSDMIWLLLRTLQVGYMGFTGPRGSWKGRGWDAEYGIMLQQKWDHSWKITMEFSIHNTDTVKFRKSKI